MSSAKQVTAYDSICKNSRAHDHSLEQNFITVMLNFYLFSTAAVRVLDDFIMSLLQR